MKEVTRDDITAMIDAAFDALAERHPECESGDVDFGVIDDLHRVLGRVARQWVNDNTARPRIAAAEMARFERMAADARAVDEDDWGSDRQIEAENGFFAAVAVWMSADFDDWCLKATSEEMLDEALRVLRGYAD